MSRLRPLRPGCKSATAPPPTAGPVHVTDIIDEVSRTGKPEHAIGPAPPETLSGPCSPGRTVICLLPQVHPARAPPAGPLKARIPAHRHPPRPAKPGHQEGPPPHRTAGKANRHHGIIPQYQPISAKILPRDDHNLPTRLDQLPDPRTPPQTSPPRTPNPPIPARQPPPKPHPREFPAFSSCARPAAPRRRCIPGPGYRARRASHPVPGHLAPRGRPCARPAARPGRQPCALRRAGFPIRRLSRRGRIDKLATGCCRHGTEGAWTPVSPTRNGRDWAMTVFNRVGIAAVGALALLAVVLVLV